MNEYHKINLKYELELLEKSIAEKRETLQQFDAKIWRCSDILLYIGYAVIALMIIDALVPLALIWTVGCSIVGIICLCVSSAVVLGIIGGAVVWLIEKYYGDKKELIDRHISDVVRMTGTIKGLIE